MFLIATILMSLTSITSPTPVILLILEGLTDRLISRVATPALDLIASKGTMMDLIPEFPAKTLPTLQSMVTGHHTEMTGVLDTAVRGLEGEIGPGNVEFWNYDPNITTLWGPTNGVRSHRTGSVMWPGVDLMGGIEDKFRWQYKTDEKRRKRDNLKEDNTTRATIKGESEEDKKEILTDEKQETISSSSVQFDKTTDREWLMWDDQMRSVVSWLTNKKEPVDLVMMFVSQPGDQITAFGPDSIEADKAVGKVDMMVASLVEMLAKVDLGLDKINMVITGGHGFTEVSTDKVFDLTSLVDMSIMTGHSPILNIQPEEHKSLDTYANIQRSGDKDKFTMWPRNQIPERFHYKNNDRVADIVLLAKEGHVFGHDFWPIVKKLNSEHSRPNSLSNKYGLGGYDNILDSMRSVVLMSGPGVAVGGSRERSVMSAVDMFPMVLHLLGITPPSGIAGSLNQVRNSLRSPPSHTVEIFKQTVEYYTEKDRLPVTVGWLVGGTILSIFLICCLACCIRRRGRKSLMEPNFKYSQVKSNRRTEGGGDVDCEQDDKVGLLTSTIMEEEFMEADFMDPI